MSRDVNSFQPDHWEHERKACGDLLRRLFVAHYESGSEYLVPSNYFVERLLERRDIDLPFNDDCIVDVISDIARFPLIDEPEPLLSKRQRHQRLAGRAANCGRRRIAS